jgi:D-arabinose 1-dehydrogenase-like Zn-dependent alcohol dehydrogenase
MDAVLVPWRALRHRAQVAPGDIVLIVGAGDLGLHGVQVARSAGCGVAVIDPVASHRAVAVELGADLAATPDDAEEALSGWTEDGVDVAFEVSGSPSGFRQGTDALRAGGVIVCAGDRPGVDYAVDSSRLALAQLRIEGNRGGNVEHAREALAAVERGDIRPLVDRIEPLERVNDLLSALAQGEVTGRVVVQMA